MLRTLLCTVSSIAKLGNQLSGYFAEWLWYFAKIQLAQPAISLWIVPFREQVLDKCKTFNNESECSWFLYRCSQDQPFPKMNFMIKIIHMFPKIANMDSKRQIVVYRYELFRVNTFFLLIVIYLTLTFTHWHQVHFRYKIIGI